MLFLIFCVLFLVGPNIAAGSFTSKSVSWILIVTVFVIYFVFIRSFMSATTVVTFEQFEFRFLYGWPRTRLPRSEIVSHEIIEISGWVGAGIRGISGGWLWRVWGRSCVEIRKVNGKRLVVGTDDPEGLSQALNR
jgi:hypothetical protein